MRLLWGGGGVGAALAFDCLSGCTALHVGEEGRGRNSADTATLAPLFLSKSDRHADSGSFARGMLWQPPQAWQLLARQVGGNGGGAR